MKLLLITITLSIMFIEFKVEGAQCRMPPPKTANARAIITDLTHGSRVLYLCDNYFIKVKFGNVVCDFGIWKGDPAVCIDSRCTREALSFQGFLLPKKRFYLSGEKLKPSCQKGYYQTMENNDLICEKGTWIGLFPPCTPDGTPYSKKNETASDKSSTEKPRVWNATTLTTTIIPFTSVSEPAVSKTITESQSTLNPDCFCTYAGFDENLVAFVGTERLQNGSKVENGSALKLFCHPFGYFRLHGLVEILCQDCQWQTSKFPECALPKIGETTLFINGDWKLLPGGIVEIKKGKIVSILCDVKGVELVPQWSHPVVSSIYTESYQDHYTERNVSMLYIFNTDVEHAGKYQCFVPGYAPYVIHIEVIVEQCPEIQEEEGMTISYTAGLSIGSIAAFHCFSPRVRSGVSRTTCKQNGEWKDPVPTCALPTCLVDWLFRVVPQNVVPDIETVSSEYVPFNSTITLKCEDGFRLYGPDKAKCGLNGVWEVSKVQCIPGCSYPLRSQDSDLIIEPNKDFYRLGELITLSCPPGQVLSDEVVRLLCFNSGWSQEDLPQCIDE